MLRRSRLSRRPVPLFAALPLRLRKAIDSENRAQRKSLNTGDRRSAGRQGVLQRGVSPLIAEEG